MTRQFTIPQAVRHFRVTERTIRRWIKNSKVNAELVDGRYLISVDLTDSPDIDNDMSDDTSMDMSTDNSNSELLKQARKENTYLQEIISEKDKQIDHFQQLLGLAQKNIAQLTEQMDSSQQMIEDLRHRPWWRFWRQ